MLPGYEGGGRQERTKDSEGETHADRARRKNRGTEHKGRRCFSFIFTFSAIGSLGCFGLLFSFSARNIFDYPGIKHQNLKCNLDVGNIDGAPDAFGMLL